MNREEFYVGIDPSLKGNAVSVINSDGHIVHEVLVSTDKECYINNEQRISDIFNQVKFVANINNLKYVYVEDLPYSTDSTTLYERCGLLFLITTYLFRKDIPFKRIVPTQLKKWHTTYGHADKPLMIKVAKCKYDINFEDDNLCDAYCLARMALEKENEECLIMRGEN